MKLKYKEILHQDITPEVLHEICDLKDQSWTYGQENQLNWIEENINDNDLHVLGYQNKLISYANLVERDVNLSGNALLNALGIGNICISKEDQGKGLGNNLMKTINILLLKKDKVGLLFCKDLLVPFYQKNDWTLIDSEKLGDNLKSFKSNVLMYNVTTDFKKIELIGASF